MSRSKLFTDAHKMTKMEISMSQRNVALTIQPNETYRYKFGQWLIFLKNGTTNTLGFTNINQSVCYVPVLKHDKEYYYSVEKPFTIKRSNKSGYSESYYINKYLFSLLKFICTNPLSLFIMFMITMFIVL